MRRKIGRQNARTAATVRLRQGENRQDRWLNKVKRTLARAVATRASDAASAEGPRGDVDADSAPVQLDDSVSSQRRLQLVKGGLLHGVERRANFD
jgi:hypothetical protein